MIGFQRFTIQRSQPPSIDVDEMGRVGIAFGRTFAGGFSIFYTSKIPPGNFFEPKDIVSPGGDDGFWQNWPEVKVGDGGAYIAYPQSNPDYTCCSNPGRRDLYYTKLNAVDGTTIVSPVNFAQRVQANFDGGGKIIYDAGKAHLSYWDYKESMTGKGKKKKSSWQPQIKYLVLNADNGSVFSGPETVAEDGIQPALGFNGQAHISFTRQSDVFYASNTTPSSAMKSATTSPSELENELASIPLAFRLQQNYPNPFNPETAIRYQLPEATHISLKVYNFSGQFVRALFEGEQSPGSHSVVWDGMDDLGQNVASGVYLIQMTAGIFTASQKITLMR
jgi:hypothetical protein